MSMVTPAVQPVHHSLSAEISELRPYLCEGYPQLRSQLEVIVNRVKEEGIAPVVQWESQAIKDRGINGDELRIDFVYVGPDPKTSLIDVIQVDAGGIHGVEAPASSAQVLYNLDNLKDLPANTGYLFIPCQNPFGLDQQRRVDAGNIDLNRTYAHYHNGKLPGGSFYNLVSPLLNPTSENGWRYTLSFWAQAIYMLARYGLETCTQGITEGQGRNTDPMLPTGIEYPGEQLPESAEILTKYLETFFGNCQFGKSPRFYLIDHHTGLGRKGVDRDVVLCHCPEDSPKHEQLMAALPNTRLQVQNPEATSGQMNRGFERLVSKILKTQEVSEHAFAVLQEIPTGDGSLNWRIELLRATIDENYYDQQVRCKGEEGEATPRDLSDARVVAYRDCFFHGKDEEWLRGTLLAGNDAFVNIQKIV